MIRAPSLQRIATGFTFLEGPVWCPPNTPAAVLCGMPGGGLMFSDLGAGRMYSYSEGRIALYREPSRGANGNALDTSGCLVTCEHESRRVSRTEAEGSVSEVVARYRDRRFNSPNDVVVRSDGAVYFTDPPYGVEPAGRELEFQGVFRLTAGASEPELEARDCERPNGLAFAPDESVLYVADTAKAHLRQFAVQPDGRLSGGEIFCSVARPDGLRVDAAGNVYVAALTGIEVFDTAGGARAGVELPERPANLAFGEEDGRTLFICARTSLYSVRVDIHGSGFREAAPS